MARIIDESRMPNPLPRPENEEAELLRIWAAPKGWKWFTAVNNTTVGLLYIGAAFTFFILAGLLALVMRTQLAVPDNNLVSQDLYNQLFTVHGTTMMFLFAVPAMEALGVLLLPQMLAARDLPFPRLSAFAVWAYIVGGGVFFSTIFYGLAPKGGWFMYPPLTLTEFSPGDNADFWLSGHWLHRNFRDCRRHRDYCRHPAHSSAGDVAGQTSHFRLGHVGFCRHDHGGVSGGDSGDDVPRNRAFFRLAFF